MHTPTRSARGIQKTTCRRLYISTLCDHACIPLLVLPGARTRPGYVTCLPIRRRTTDTFHVTPSPPAQRISKSDHLKKPQWQGARRALQGELPAAPSHRRSYIPAAVPYHIIAPRVNTPPRSARGTHKAACRSLYINMLCDYTCCSPVKRSGYAHEIVAIVE